MTKRGALFLFLETLLLLENWHTVQVYGKNGSFGVQWRVVYEDDPRWKAQGSWSTRLAKKNR